MQRMRIVRGGAAVNRCVSVSSLKLLNNLQLFSICSNQLAERIKDTNVDDTGNLILTGKKPTDHNTITFTTPKTAKTTRPIHSKIWAPGNKDKWTKYNKEMETLHKNQDLNYDNLEKHITRTLQKETGTITIRGKGMEKETKIMKNREDPQTTHKHRHRTGQDTQHCPH